MTLTTSTNTVRANIRDNSAASANQAFSDAQIYAKINDAMRLVQRRFYPRIARQTAAQTGLSFAGGGNGIASTTPTNYARIIAISPGTAFGGIIGAALTVDEFFAKRGGQLSTAPNPPQASYIVWTCWREGAASGSTQGAWAVAIYPPPSTNPTTFSALVELEQADLSGGSDTMDLPPEGVTMVENLASFWLAKILGREYADAFMATYPELKELASMNKSLVDKVEGRRA